MWNGYGVCSNLASSGEPPPLHMTTLTAEVFQYAVGLQFWHKSFNLDVNLTKLSNNSFEWKNVLSEGVETYSNPSYIFSGGDDPNPPPESTSLPKGFSLGESWRHRLTRNDLPKKNRLVN